MCAKNAEIFGLDQWNCLRHWEDRALLSASRSQPGTQGRPTRRCMSNSGYEEPLQVRLPMLLEKATLYQGKSGRSASTAGSTRAAVGCDFECGTRMRTFSRMFSPARIPVKWPRIPAVYPASK